MNSQKLQEVQKKVLQIKELNDHIKKNLVNKSSWLFVSKSDYNAFVLSVAGKFPEFIIEYCDKKVETNPRWAYYAYKCSGTNQKYLSHYQLEAVKDIPWKYVLVVIAISMATNFSFRGIAHTPLLIPAILTTIYFLCTHILTLIALFKFNCCTNVKGLFRNTAIAMILLTLMTNITSVL